MPDNHGSVGYDGDLGAVHVRNGKIVGTREHLHPTFRQRLALWLTQLIRRVS